MILLQIESHKDTYVQFLSERKGAITSWAAALEESKASVKR